MSNLKFSAVDNKISKIIALFLLLVLVFASGICFLFHPAYFDATTVGSEYFDAGRQNDIFNWSLYILIISALALMSIWTYHIMKDQH